MNSIYNTAIALYGLGIKAAAIFKPKPRLLADGQKAALPYLRSKLDADGGYIWIHASSLGEFEQGRPLIEMIRRDRPEAKILLTFFSPSGYEVRKDFPAVDAVCYLPLDRPANVRRFLDVVKPSMAIFVKYEFWGNYLQELRRRGVPTYIISAIFRPTQAFFKPWGRTFRRMLECYTHIFVQDEDSRRLLASIGIRDVTVCGDTRLDRVTDIQRAAVPIEAAQAMTSAAGNDAVTVVAGSTWPPDEQYLIPYFNSHPELRLIIAPHEVRPDRIDGILSSLTRPAVLLSKATPEEAAKAECIIVDCYGKLSSLYRYGRLAYVGGGFGVGIHNINEAAVYGMPVVFGPNYRKFKEAHDLIACGGAFSYHDMPGFETVMNPLVSDHATLRRAGDAAAGYIKSHLGATKAIYDAIFAQC